MYNVLGEKVVAVLGGEAKGMEVWNPQDSSVILLYEQIPPEANATTKGKKTFFKF